MYNRLVPFSILVVPFYILTVALAATEAKKQRPDEVVSIFKACGFKAREYQIVTKDSVILSIVRATNPLFNSGKHGLAGKQPVVYIQGTTLGTALALDNSKHVRPRDFSHLDADKLSKKQLMKEVGSDPSARNLIFLTLNFGHEVWLLRRRGYAGSRHRVQDVNRTIVDAIKSIPDTLLGFKYLGGLSTTAGLTAGRPRGESNTRKVKRSLPEFDANAWLTGEMMRLLNESSTLDDQMRALLTPLPLIKMPEGLLLFTDENFQQDFIDSYNPDFWNFSLDEQAKYDLPGVVDFVLKKTGEKKVHLVGLSCGGAIILLSHAENPKLAEKVGASVLWAPSVNLGSGSDIVYQLSHVVPIFQTLVGPLPTLFINKPLQKIMRRICTSSRETMRICRLIYDSIFGYGGKQSKMGAVWWTDTFVSSPTNELKHLGQMAHTNQTCKFNYNTPQKNLEVYGQPIAPCYNFSKIETPNLFFYVSDDDRLVSLTDIKATLEQLSCGYTLEHISEKGIRFNHLGYIVHEQNARLAILPTLKNIASVEAKELKFKGRGGQERPRVKSETTID